VNGRPWGESELQALRRLAKRGVSLRLAGKVLGRSEAAVAIKASEKQIKFHGGPGGAPLGNQNGKGRRNAGYW